MCFGLSQRSPSVDNPIDVAALILVLIMQRETAPLRVEHAILSSF